MISLMEKAKVREVLIGSTKVVLRKARVNVNKENVAVLSFLELMNYVTPSFFDAERKKIVEDYIQRILIPQCKDIEDELVRSCDVKNVAELTGSKSVSNFKTDFCASKDLRALLKRHKFCIDHLWILEPNGEYSKYKQESRRIKK